ncbi:hypothetical protein GCM10022254_16350 [Actinomadura meridiana]|uniref:Uncharacterized protein n=1 Tax=Actinomadura meridiana TaxID=559626 RepID=A0ABP8BW04_9ACTN
MGIDRPSGTEKRLDDIGRVPAQDRPPPDRPGQPGYPSRLESRRAAREAALVTQQDSQDAGQPPEAAEKSDHDQPTQAESAIGEDAADCAGVSSEQRRTEPPGGKARPRRRRPGRPPARR